MKIAALAVALALAAPAYAADDAKPPKPTCGSTAEECQKVVDSVNAQLAAANKRISAYRELLIEANDRVTQQASK